MNIRMGRQTCLILGGITLAFLMCAINFSILAKRTMMASPTSEMNGNGIPEEVISSSGFIRRGDGGGRSASVVGDDVDSCFRARKDTVPRSMYGNLSLPLINLGFPKMGTSSIHAFFGCAGYRSYHYRCTKTTICAHCIKDSLRENLPPLAKCGSAEVYSQLDGGIDHTVYMPQIELLEELVHGYPNATFLMTFRSMEKWYKSISNWPPTETFWKLKLRLAMSNITGLPTGKGQNLQDFSEFFCNHVQRVRAIVPPHRLVEIDIEDPTIHTRMADVFNIDEECWGQANANDKLHPELNGTRMDFPWQIRGKIMIRGKNGVMRRKHPPVPLPSDIASSSAVMNRGLERYQAKETGGGIGANIIHKEYGDTIHNATGSKMEGSFGETLESTSAQSRSWSDSCKELIAHQNGYWHHMTSSDIDTSQILNDTSVTQMYFPQEMNWLKSHNRPRDFRHCEYSNRYLMYNSVLGNHCGCGVKAFKPTHSVWVYNTTKALPETNPRPKTDYFAASPTLRLVRDLANADATMCFAGDSIDYQIYSALATNLRRVDQLHQFYSPGKSKLVTVMTREIPVTHSTVPGNGSDWFLNGYRPPDLDVSFTHPQKNPTGGFGHYAMSSILETKALFPVEQPGGKAKLARIRYYMSYGWSPWNTDFMEDCNVIIMNFALHYNPDGEHLGRETKHTLMDDMYAAITYLSNFTASKDNRVAVWRSALPQNFATRDGHFHGWKKLKKAHTCSAIDKGAQQQQAYNEVYDEAFTKMCQHEQQSDDTTNESCDHFSHRCSVDPLAEVDYQTIFNFWSVNNCTDRIKKEELRLSNFSGSNEGGGGRVAGTIHRWNVFDLFDFEWWHSKDMDCSHYCYVPPLFEAAFDRLGLLLSPLVASFDRQHLGKAPL